MNPNLGNEDIAVIDNLVDDKKLSFIIKKISRLANALLYISSLMNTHRSIKDRIESSALDINNCIPSLLSGSYLKNTGTVQIDWSQVSGKLVSLINLLNSALIVGAVSEKNYQVFSSEIANVTGEIKALVKIHSEQLRSLKSSSNADAVVVELPKKMFSVGGSGHLNSKNSQGVNNLKSIKESGRNVAPRAYYKRHISIKDNLSQNPNPQSVARDNNTLPGAGVPVSTLNKRQLDIINILAISSNLSIKDFSLRIKDCSEKTIQRELNYLTDMGLISKTGEKRWTRYHRLKNDVVTAGQPVEKMVV